MYDTDEIIAGEAREGATYAEAVRRGRAKAAALVRASPGPVVFVGTTLRISRAQRFHISIEPMRLEAAWRRTLARELTKVARALGGALRAVAKAPAPTLPDVLMLRYGIGALDLMTTLPEYIRMERAARRYAKKEGATIGPQRKARAWLEVFSRGCTE